MKKIILVVVILALATPAMAVIDINAVDEGSGVVRIDYDASGHGQLPRAFALNITVDAGTIDDVSSYFIGEGAGYGIFPGSIDINETTGVVDDNGTPVGDPCAFPDTLPGLDTNGVTIEMGSLYVGGPNAPAAGGTLCRVTVSANCTLSVSGNIGRGRVVNEDATEATTNLPISIPVVVVSLCIVPDVVGDTQADATTAITTAGLSAGAVTTANSNTMPTGRIISTDPVGETEVDCGSDVNMVRSIGPACKGDINASGTVNSSDIIAIATLVGTYGAGIPKSVAYGSANYNSRGDANQDEKVNSSDIIKIATWVGTYGTGIPKSITCPHSYN